MAFPRETDVTPFATQGDVREVLERIDQRFNDQKEFSNQRHAENVQRLEFIAQQTSKTNGRVSVLEAGFLALSEEFKGIRVRWHGFRDSIQDAVNRHLGTARAVAWDDRPISRKEIAMMLGLIIAAVSITATVTVFVMTHGKP